MKLDFWEPRNSRKMGFTGKLNMSFLQLLPTIWALFDVFSKFCSAFSILHFEKSSNMSKNLSKNEVNGLVQILETL